MSENNLFPRKKDIFQKSTKDLQTVVGRPSFDTQFQVIFSFGNYQRWLEEVGGDISRARTSGLDFKEKMSIMCTEAELPGTNFETSLAVGHHQGIQEEFPTLRNFPPLNLTFYVDADHVILEVLETWMTFINPIQKGMKRSLNAFGRFNYPEEYKEILHITKFERDAFVDQPQRSRNNLERGLPPVPRDKTQSKLTSYEFVNVFPKNMTSMRVAYGDSAVLRCSVTFVYDRFFTKFHYDDSLSSVENTPFNLSNDVLQADPDQNKPWWLNTLKTAARATPIVGAVGAGLYLGKKLYNNLFN